MGVRRCQIVVCWLDIDGLIQILWRYSESVMLFKLFGEKSGVEVENSVSGVLGLVIEVSSNSVQRRTGNGIMMLKIAQSVEDKSLLCDNVVNNIEW